MSHFLHWCYTWIALLSANQNRVIFSCILLSKWVKWNISVEHEIVFPRLNFLWDDSITLRCFFVVVCLFVFFVFSFAIYFSSSLHILWDVCLWNYIFHPSNSCYFTKCMAFLFAHIQSARPNKASNGHHPLSEELLNSLAHVFRFVKLWQTTGLTLPRPLQSRQP